MEFEIDKYLNRTIKKLENTFLTALRKAVPKCFNIEYSKHEILSNKLKAMVELNSKGYYKIKTSIKEAEKLCIM